MRRLARHLIGPIGLETGWVSGGSVRNHRPDLSGILVVDKPVGMSSASVCAIVRRATGGAKVGHAGTLDPLASGVLVLCLGNATRSAEAVMRGEKEYLTEIDLAHFSTTDDLEGEPTPVVVDAPPDEAALRDAMSRFVGNIEQRPPVYSAAHVDGVRAYKSARRAARAGEAAPERPPARLVTVHSFEILEFTWPRMRARVRCGKGVYIRSLARDLGEALGVGGRLLSLQRRLVGPYSIEQSRTVDSLRAGIVPHELLPTPAATGSSSGSSASGAASL